MICALKFEYVMSFNDSMMMKIDLFSVIYVLHCTAVIGDK